MRSARGILLMMISNFKIIRIEEVSEITGLSRSSVYRKIKDGTFPPAVRLGEMARGWRLSDIRDWIAGLPTA